VFDTTATPPLTRNVDPRIAVALGDDWKPGASFHAGVRLASRDEWSVAALLIESPTGTSAGDKENITVTMATPPRVTRRCIER
jgi:hypothetical protein